jgi:hypothetical protein
MAAPKTSVLQHRDKDFTELAYRLFGEPDSVSGSGRNRSMPSAVKTIYQVE